MLTSLGIPIKNAIETHLLIAGNNYSGAYLSALSLKQKMVSQFSELPEEFQVNINEKKQKPITTFLLKVNKRNRKSHS